MLKVKGRVQLFVETHLRATERHLPYRITELPVTQHE